MGCVPRLAACKQQVCAWAEIRLHLSPFMITCACRVDPNCPYGHTPLRNRFIAHEQVVTVRVHRARQHLELVPACTTLTYFPVASLVAKQRANSSTSVQITHLSGLLQSGSRKSTKLRVLELQLGFSQAEPEVLASAGCTNVVTAEQTHPSSILSCSVHHLKAH